MAATATASASSADAGADVSAAGAVASALPTVTPFVPTLRMMPEVRRKDGLAPVSVVVASTLSGGIGKDGKLPWDIRTDMSFFRETTKSTRAEDTRNAAIMGRRTWTSIPAKHRPLKGRINSLLSRSDAATVRSEEGLPEDVAVDAGLAKAIERIRAGDDKVETIHIIGGASAFTEAVATGVADVLYVTEIISPAFETDVSMQWPPRSGTAFHKTMTGSLMEENGAQYRFTQWVNTSTATASAPLEAQAGFAYSTADGEISAYTAAAPADFSAPLAGELDPEDAGRTSIPDIAALAAALAPGSHPEQQYLALIRDIICTGVRRGDRTGTGTLSKFGVQMRFSLRDGVLPLLTTKRVFWRGVAEELLWFVSGDTSARTLQDKDIHIWDGNGSREFLDKSGLGHREEGDLGPVYGFQWRHFGASYKDMHADYAGQGVDQLKQVVEKIKTKPNDRRIILTAWNPAAIPEMALPPCHMFAQFFVANGELSCQMYQRSADMGLGVPFNIASYALLTYMLAHVTGLVPGDFIHVIGDAHVYLNHVAPLREQLTREPRAFPTLRIKRDVTDIDDFKYDDFEVVGYKPHKTIKMKMAV